MICYQIIVHRPSTLEWIESIGMNHIRSKKPGVIQWRPGKYDLKFDRVIFAINGNEITIDAPMGSSFDRKYGGGWIYKYKYLKRIEHLRGVSEFDENKKDHRRQGEFIDENHSWNFAVFSQIKNAWAKQVTSVHWLFVCHCWA